MPSIGQALCQIQSEDADQAQGYENFGFIIIDFASLKKNFINFFNMLAYMQSLNKLTKVILMGG